MCMVNPILYLLAHPWSLKSLDGWVQKPLREQPEGQISCYLQLLDQQGHPLLSFANSRIW